MARKLTKAEQIAQIPWDTLSRIKDDEAGRKQLQGYLKTLRSGYSRRVAAFNRKNLFSYAQNSFESSLPEGYKVPKISSLNRNKLLLEIARYVKFFNDVTSTEKGIKQVNTEQDARIFGTDAFGRPTQRMAQSEREEYWKLYQEFEKQFPIWVTQPYSDETQKYLAYAFFQDDEFNKLSLAAKLEYLNNMIQEGRSIIDLEEYPNDYAGRGPNIT